MKTKKFGKLIALALCVAMAFSMSATAFAAGPSENNAGYVGVETVETVAIEADDNSTLAPSTYKMYSLGELTAGQIVRIVATWEDSTYDLHIGLVLGGSTGTNLYVGTDGFVDIYTTIPKDGTYYLMIANPSTTETLTDIHWAVAVYNPE